MVSQQIRGFRKYANYIICLLAIVWGTTFHLNAKTYEMHPITGMQKDVVHQFISIKMSGNRDNISFR